jgi:hypothetical protein
MGRQSNMMKLLFEEMQSKDAIAQTEKLAAQTELQNRIAAGPPVGSGIATDAWRCWNEYGWLACPRTGNTCSNLECGIGASCKAMATFGLAGDGTPLVHARRPICAARNRQGRPCCNKVVPGKRRCRFHGGLSTGPRTPEGRARIAAAQKLRWANFRTNGQASEIPSGVRPKVPDPVFLDAYREADEEMVGDSFMTI